MSRRKSRKANEAKTAWRVPWWRRCKVCGDDFRFEHAWEGKWTVGMIPVVWHAAFACARCCPTAEEASVHFGVLPPNLPKLPAPPPPPSPYVWRDRARLERQRREFYGGRAE